MKNSKIEVWLPEELVKSLEKYADKSKESKEDILRKALHDFFENHPLEEWDKNVFEELANISRKIISEENKS